MNLIPDNHGQFGNSDRQSSIAISNSNWFQFGYHSDGVLVGPVGLEEEAAGGCKPGEPKFSEVPPGTPYHRYHPRPTGITGIRLNLIS